MLVLMYAVAFHDVLLTLADCTAHVCICPVPFPNERLGILRPDTHARHPIRPSESLARRLLWMIIDSFSGIAHCESEPWERLGALVLRLEDPARDVWGLGFNGFREFKV